MIRWRFVCLLAVTLGLNVPSVPACAAPAAPAPPASSPKKVEEGKRVMVMLRLGADHYEAGSGYGGGYGGAMSEAGRLRFARQIAQEHKLTVIEAWPMPRIGVDCVIMGIGDDRSPQEVAKELTGLPGIAWSQPLNEFRMQGTSDAPVGSYNDRLYRAQPVANRWHLADLHRVATGRGVTVAIVDSRIDTTHPDLAGRIAATPNFTPVRDQEGERHGTGVAGIIAARENNAQGIAGIAPGARVLGVRACWERPHGGTTVCDSLSLAKALTYALDNRADVINMSLSGPRDRLLETLIGLAVARGTAVVAAVDEARPETSFPAYVSGVIPVADERLSARANAVYIAPGRDIPTTEPEGKWNLVNGSSFAAAHVSGLIAILRQLSSNRGGKASVTSLLGARGPVDACAAVERLSRVDVEACRASN